MWSPGHYVWPDLYLDQAIVEWYCTVCFKVDSFGYHAVFYYTKVHLAAFNSYILLHISFYEYVMI